MNLLIIAIAVLTLIKKGDISYVVTTAQYSPGADIVSTKGNFRIAGSYRDQIPQVAYEPKGIHCKLATRRQKEETSPF